MNSYIAFRNLTLAYDRHPAVHHLSTEIHAGSLTAIVGPNGSGKTTLLKSLLGQVKPVEGEIDFKGLCPRDIAYLPQQSGIDRRFPLTVEDFLLTGLWRHLGLIRAADKHDRRRIQEALHCVGLAGFQRRLIGSLSGGQFQRVLFARLFLQNRPVMLLDEPFTAIDSKTASDLLDLLLVWHGEARTLLVVTHDIDQVRHSFPNTLLLARKLLAHGPTDWVMTADNLLKARQMCESFDDQAAVCRHYRDAA